MAHSSISACSVTTDEDATASAAEINMFDEEVTNRAVAEAFDMPYSDRFDATAG